MDDSLKTFTNQPTVVIKLSTNLSNEAIAWLIDQISADKTKNGCQLSVVYKMDLLFVR